MSGRAFVRDFADAEAKFAASPIHKALGLTLSVREPGRVDVHYDGNPNGANRRGNAAGGALAQMVDSAVVQACKTMIEDSDVVATLELKVNYLRPGPPNARLITEGSIEHLGRSTSVGIARVRSDDGKLVALGTATVSIKRHSPT